MLISNSGLIWISILFTLDIRGGAKVVVSRCAHLFHIMFLLVQGEGGIVKSAPYKYDNVE